MDANISEATSLQSCTIDQLIEQFPNLISHYSQLSTSTYSRFSQDRVQAETQRKKEAINLVKQSIANQMGQRFALIDQRLLDLERWLIIHWEGSITLPPTIVAEHRAKPEAVPLAGELANTRKQTTECVKVPLVLRRSEMLHHRRLPIVKHPNASARSWRGEYALTCRFPGELDPSLYPVANEALAMFHDQMARLYRSDWAHLAFDLKNAVPTLDALWIPRLSDLGFVSQSPQICDPVLVVRFSEHLFLAGSWQMA
jgi:hypothetical protein